MAGNRDPGRGADGLVEASARDGVRARVSCGIYPASLVGDGRGSELPCRSRSFAHIQSDDYCRIMTRKQSWVLLPGAGVVAFALPGFLATSAAIFNRCGPEIHITSCFVPLSKRKRISLTTRRLASRKVRSGSSIGSCLAFECRRKLAHRRADNQSFQRDFPIAVRI